MLSGDDLTPEEYHFIQQQQEKEDRIKKEREIRQEQENEYTNLRPAYVKLRECFSTRTPNLFQKSQVERVQVLYDKLGMFNVAYTVIISFKDTRDIRVTRKEKDFEWLECELADEMPGVFVKPLSLTLKVQKRYSSSGANKAEERIVKGKPFQRFLQGICDHPKIPQEATCVWDFLTANEKEMEAAKEAQSVRLARTERLISLSFKAKKWKASRTGLISLEAEEQNERMMRYVKEFNKSLQTMHSAIPRYEAALNSIRDSYDSIGKEFKIYGNTDYNCHDVFHHVGDQMREVSILERERRHKKQNREVVFKSNVDFFLELTGGDIIQRFLGRENQARLEQEVLKTELEELVGKQEKMYQKISDKQIGQYREQKFQEKFAKLMEKARAEHEGDQITAASIDVDSEDVSDAPSLVIGMKPGFRQDESKKQTPEEQQLEKIHRDIFFITHLLNRAAQRIWQVCEYKRFEFLRLENELRGFLQNTLIDSFCNAMYDDHEPYIEAMSKCTMERKVAQMIEEFSEDGK